LIKRFYRGMVTLLWRAKTADEKTRDDNAAWTAMIQKREEWLTKPQVAAVLAKLGTWKEGDPLPPQVMGQVGTLSDIENDRVTASIKAATKTGSAVTAAQIRVVARAQVQQVSAVVRALTGGK
jgi:hypothetical protein